MVTRLLASILAASMLLASAPSNAAVEHADAQRIANEKAKLAEARAIVEVVFPLKQRRQIIEKMLADITEPIRTRLIKVDWGDEGVHALNVRFLDEMEEEERAFVENHLPDMIDAMTIAYTHQFSLQELKDIRAFARTPSGSDYLSRSSDVLKDPALAKMNSALLDDGLQFSVAKTAQFRDQLVAYLKANPDAAARVEVHARAAAKKP